MATEAGPSRIEGPLYKKSPAGPIFQKRTFIVDNGMLSYSSAKGSSKALPLLDVERVTQVCKERLEFCVVFRKVDETTTSHTTFLFRALDHEGFITWTQGIVRHSEFQKAKRAALAASAGGAMLKEMAPAATDLVQPAKVAGRRLAGILLKESDSFPYSWQKREVSVVGHAILYSKEGGAWQKAISLLETKTIHVTDTAKYEFQITTHMKAFKFRASERADFFRWVNALQQHHQKVTNPQGEAAS